MKSRLEHITLEQWRRLAHEAGYCVARLAAACKVSVSTLRRHLRSVTGQSPHTWMRHLRMGRAAELLADGSKVAWVAAELGYAGDGHFSREFRRQWGYPPSEHADRIFSCRSARQMTDFETCWRISGP